MRRGPHVGNVGAYVATFSIGNQFLANSAGTGLFVLAAAAPFGVNAATFLIAAVVDRPSIDEENDAELVGALDVYGSTDGAFDPLDTALLRMLTLAASATISMWGRLQQARDVIDQLDEALLSRAEIEQAKGVVMALNKVSADEAFEPLVKMSQDSNTKLRELSRQLLASLRNE